LGLSKPLRADRSSTRRRARSVITAISSDVSAEARRKRTWPSSPGSNKPSMMPQCRWRWRFSAEPKRPSILP